MNKPKLKLSLLKPKSDSFEYSITTTNLSDEEIRIDSKVYIKDKILGKGTFKIAFSAHEKENDSNKVVLYVFEIANSNNIYRELDIYDELTKFNKDSSCKNFNLLCVKEVIFGKDQRDIETNIIPNDKFIITEYLEDYISLDKFIEAKQSLTTKNILYIMYQLVNSILFLHDNEIVHHDIKPQNIMINPENLHVVVIDFGVSCFLKGNKYLCKNAELSTPLYANPKYQYDIAYDIDKDYDIFSLGLVMYELVFYKHLWNKFIKDDGSYNTTKDELVNYTKDKIKALRNEIEKNPTNIVLNIMYQLLDYDEKFSYKDLLPIKNQLYLYIM
jgi:serine/threonine protein kinase